MKFLLSVRLGRLLLRGALAASILGLPGCANLAAVRSFADTSAATAGYPQAVDDFVKSPLRQRETSAPADTASLTRQAREREKLRAGLLQVQKALAEYMGALGAMAANDFPSVDQEVAGLANAIPNTYVDAPTKAATGAIAKLLNDAVLGTWRQRKVKSMVAAADPHVQAIVSGLTTGFVAPTRQSLLAEREELRRFFLDAASSTSSPEQQRLVLYLLKSYQRSLDARDKNLQAYEAALAKIATGHTYLNAHLDAPDSKEVRAQLTQYAKDLQAIYKTLTPTPS